MATSTLPHLATVTDYSHSTLVELEQIANIRGIAIIGATPADDTDTRYWTLQESDGSKALVRWTRGERYLECNCRRTFSTARTVKCPHTFLVRSSLIVRSATPIQSSVVNLSNVPVTPTPASVELRSIRDGRYTIVAESGEHTTLRITTQPIEAGFAPGKQIVAYLSGPDNDNDYRGFAFIANGRVSMWSRFKANQHLASCVEMLLDPATASSAGLAYAVASGRCCRCGRTLTVPASISMGMGPDCASK